MSSLQGKKRLINRIQREFNVTRDDANEWNQKYLPIISKLINIKNNAIH